MLSCLKHSNLNTVLSLKLIRVFPILNLGQIKLIELIWMTLEIVNINLCMTAKLPIIKNTLPCDNRVSCRQILLYIVNKHKCNLFSGFAIRLFLYLFCICFVKNSYDIHIAIVFNIFDSEIATINMCDIHIATILLTVSVYCIYYLNNIQSRNCNYYYVIICAIYTLQLLIIVVISESHIFFK